MTLIAPLVCTHAGVVTLPSLFELD